MNKCTYSNLNLASILYLWYTNEGNPESIYSELSELYSNPEEAFNDLVKEFDSNLVNYWQNNNISPAPSESGDISISVYQENQHIDENTDFENQPTLIPQDIYLGDLSRYKTILSDFSAKMIRLSVLSESESGISLVVPSMNDLNRKIAEFKVSLLNKLSSDTITIDEFMSNSDKSDRIISNYTAKLGSDVINYNSEEYDSFIMLVNFDKWLPELASYIMQNKGKTVSNENKYSYIGPIVNHYGGLTGSKEHVDATVSASKLSKIILNNLSEVDENGNDVAGSYIGSTSFASIMSKAINDFNTNIHEYGMSQTLEATTDFTKILNKYKYRLMSGQVAEDNKTNHVNKINGIVKYVFNSDNDALINEMYAHMAIETKSASYTEYSFTTKSGMIQAYDNTEKNILLDKLMVSNRIDAIKYMSTEYGKQYRTILNESNISIHPESKQIKWEGVNGNTYTVKLWNGYSIIKNKKQASFEDISPEDLSDLLLNTMYIDIPSSALTSKSASIIIPVVMQTIFNERVDIQNVYELARLYNKNSTNDVLNVVKDADGNNLPLFKIVNVTYDYPSVFNEATYEEDSVHAENILYLELLNPILQPGIVSKVSTRSKVSTTIDGETKVKSPMKLRMEELYRVSIVFDFFQKITSDEKVLIQPLCYSDKSSHGLPHIDVWNLDLEKPDGSKASLGNTIKEGVLSNDSSKRSNAFSLIMDNMYRIRKARYDKLSKNILDDYNHVFNGVKEFKNLHDIDAHLESESYSSADLKKLFNDKGLDFLNEIHATVFNGTARVNETILGYVNMYKSEDVSSSFKDRVYKSIHDTISDIESREMNLNTSSPEIMSIYKYFNPDSKNDESKWFDKNGNMIIYDHNATDDVDSSVEFDTNPIVLGWLLNDMFLSDLYSSAMVGGVFSHPNKSKSRDLMLAEKSRLDAQNKRNSALGTNYHPYLQNKANGVPSSILIAGIEDVAANVYNAKGDASNIDALDGSSFTSPFFSRLQNNSLGAFAVGVNKKTIMTAVDHKYNRFMLLKHAEFELSNNYRRFSSRSKNKAELMVEKMHSINFDKEFLLIDDINKFISDNEIYYKDSKTNKSYRVISIDSENKTVAEVNINGEIVSNPVVLPFKINNIYDIDQLVGGAWSQKLENGQLQWADYNVDLVVDLMTKHNGLKRYFISMLANSSAVKSGQANMNSVSRWTDSKPLTFFEMSTKFGGVVLEAEHDLESGSVREPSQMISALAQGGFTGEVAHELYNDIANVVNTALEELNENLSNSDKKELYKIVSKSLIRSFETTTDSAGLADAFIKIAKDEINNNTGKTIPFSAPTVYNKFVSDVTSMINKTGIIRRYAGSMSVQVPSYNMMQYFLINGVNYTAEELFDIANQYGIVPGEKDIVSHMIEDRFVPADSGIVHNPSIRTIGRSAVEVEDTVSIDIVHEGSLLGWIKINIDNHEKFSDLRHGSIKNTAIKHKELLTVSDEVDFEFVNNLIESGNYTPGLSKWDASPRNLAPPNITYSVIDNDGNTAYSNLTIYDWDSVRASNILGKMKVKEIQIGSLDQKSELYSILKRLKLTESETSIITSNYLNEITQFELNNISQGFTPSSVFTRRMVDGEYVDLYRIEEGSLRHHKGQIAMGRYNASKLLLRQGDSIANIKAKGPEFFAKRLNEIYDTNIDEVIKNKNLADVVLFDGKGEKIYVKLGPLDTSVKYNTNTLFNQVAGDMYFNGKLLLKDWSSSNIIPTSVNGLNYIVIPDGDINIYNRLLDESRFNTRYFIHTGQNDSVLQKIWRPDIKNSSRAVQQAFADNSFQDLLTKRAIKMYEAFEAQLTFMSPRIPTQAMNSFMASEVAIYTDETVNNVYIPAIQSWLQGSDYDIDKIFLLSYELNDKGELSSKPIDMIKNEAVSKMIGITSDVKNFLLSNNPLSMDELGAKASAIPNNIPYVINSDLPYAKFNAQIQNAIGGEAIGIYASGIKTYFMLVDFYNTKYDEIMYLVNQNDYNNAFIQLQGLQLTSPKGFTLLSGTNLGKLLKWANETTVNTIESQSLKNLILQLHSSMNPNVDAPLMLSELLSFAADNAKELALPKLNAVDDLANVYIYFISLGYTFDEIIQLTNSKVITLALSMSTENIFDRTSWGVRIKDAIGFMLDKYDPKFEGELSFVRNDVLSAFKKFAKTEYKNDFDEALKKIAPVKKARSVQYDEYDDYYEGYEEYSAEDMYDPDVYDEPTRSTEFVITNSTKLDEKAYLGLLKYVRLERIDRAKNIEINSDQMSNIKVLYKSFDDIDEMTQIRSIGSLNQGLKTSNADQYIYITKFQSFIDRKLKGMPFDVGRFLNDSEYADELIMEYESKKNNFNILSVLNSSPMFNSLFKGLMLTRGIQNRLSAKSILIESIIEKASNQRKVKFSANQNKPSVFVPNIKTPSVPVFKEISRYVDDVIILDFLKTLDLTIDIHRKFNYFSMSELISSGKNKRSIKIGTVNGAASFKLWFENHFILTLKNKYKNNNFVKLLIPYVRKHKTGSSTSTSINWGMPVNMMNLDSSDANMQTYQTMVKGFSELKGETMKINKGGQDYNIVDMIYLYNLITYKDAFNQNAMTKIFEDVVINDDNSIINQFYQYLSDMDYANGSRLVEKLDPKDLGPRLFYNAEAANQFTDISTPTLNKGYFTLNLQHTAKQESDEIIFNPVSRASKSLTSNETKSYLDQLIDSINEERGQIIHKVYDDSDVKGYIQNGQVYINMNKADNSTVLHELSHMILAVLRTGINSDEYYKLLDYTRSNDSDILRIRESLQRNNAYINKVGSDFDEEVLVRLIEQSVVGQNDYTDIFDLATSAISSIFVNHNVSDALTLLSDIGARDLGSQDTVNKVILSQKIATAKGSMVKNNKLKSDCN